ncbi:unnamed protein product, partial [Polarella glacialis]
TNVLAKGPSLMMRKKIIKDKSSLMASEEEQFHDDLLAMVSSGVQGEDGETDTGGPAKGPAPRSNHTMSLYENTAVLFGGHGGMGYQRRAFNDVWTLNLDSN